MRAVIAALGVAAGLAWSVGPLLAQDSSGESRSGPSAAVQEKAPMPGPATNAKQPIGGGAATPVLPDNHADGAAGNDAEPTPAEPDVIAPPPVTQDGAGGSGPYIRGGVGGP